MRFSNAAEGCVVLMWLVTKSVAAEMKKIMSSDEKPCLDSLTIEELNIGGRTFKVMKGIGICNFYVQNPTLLQVISGYDSIYQHSINKPEVFWADRAKEHLQWEQPFHSVVEGSLQSGMKWFSGGKINVSGKNEREKVGKISICAYSDEVPHEVTNQTR